MAIVWMGKFERLACFFHLERVIVYIVLIKKICNRIGLVLISFFFSDSLFIWTRFNSSVSFEYFTGFWWMTEMSNLCHRITCWFMILCLKCFNYYNLNELHTYKFHTFEQFFTSLSMSLSLFTSTIRRQVLQF